MAEIRVCDICGSRIETTIDGQRYRVQRENLHLYKKSEWETIDICYPCLYQLRNRSIDAHVDKERS